MLLVNHHDRAQEGEGLLASLEMTGCASVPGNINLLVKGRSLPDLCMFPAPTVLLHRFPPDLFKQLEINDLVQREVADLFVGFLNLLRVKSEP
jgi:hypothetical protein